MSERSAEPRRTAPTGLRIGLAGWSYPDWRGTFYPRDRARGFSELRYAAERFECLEINSTFYRMPDARHAERWGEEVADLPGFQFTAKLVRELTHGSPRPDDVDTLCARFLDGLRPLIDRELLGCVLAQFPWYFEDAPASRDRLRRLAASLDDVPVVVELRHRSFIDPSAGGALPFLGDLGLGFANIDLPRAASTTPPTCIATSPVGYFRLHGRNARSWFDSRAGRDQKYDYLYTRDELERLFPLLQRLTAMARITFVIANNHFQGSAPANAADLISLRERLTPGAPGPAATEDRT